MGMANSIRPTVYKVPLDLIFSGPFPAASAPWSEVPLVNLEPHMSAVRAVLQRRGGLDAYWEYARTSAGQTGNGPADRRVWEEEVARRIRRYARGSMQPPPTVGWYDRDRLILEDGHLRCCVYKVQGKSWIRAGLRPDAASRWSARPTEPLMRAVARQKRKSFYTPIDHELFRRRKSSRKGTDRLDLIRGFLGPIRGRPSVLDVGCNIGYYSFHLARQGFDAVGVESDAQHFEVAASLRQMYGLDVELWQGPFESYPRTRRFDVVLGLTVFWHFLPPKPSPDLQGPARTLVEQLEALVGHALIWESGSRASEEIDLICRNTGLRHFTLLGETSGTGVERKFGVFTRVPVNEAVAQMRRAGGEGTGGPRAQMPSSSAAPDAVSALPTPASRAD